MALDTGFIIFIWMILDLADVPSHVDLDELQSYLAVLLAINWFMDRCRTTVNVLGDSIVAAVVEEKIFGESAFTGQNPLVAAPQHTGSATVQFGSAGTDSPFEEVTLELVDGKLSFQDVESQQVLRHASLIDARVDVLKNPRKGHPHVFRVDLSGHDSVGESKYVFSVEADEDKALWMRVMRMHAALVGPAYASLVLEYDISSNVEGQTVRASLRCLSCAYPLWSLMPRCVLRIRLRHKSPNRSRSRSRTQSRSRSSRRTRSPPAAEGKRQTLQLQLTWRHRCQPRPRETAKVSRRRRRTRTCEGAAGRCGRAG